MSVSLSRALVLIILAYLAGFWSAHNVAQVEDWGRGTGQWVADRVNRVQKCPEIYSCKPKE